MNVIKYLSPTITASSYVIKILNRKTNASGWVKDPIINFIEQLSLPIASSEEIKQYPILREREDYLQKKAIEISYQELMRSEAEPNITYIKTQLDPIVAEYIILENAYRLLNHIPGFERLLKETVENFHRLSYPKKKNHLRGKLFELECAIRLVEKENRQIYAISRLLGSASNKREFDIETIDGELIECKYTEQHIEKGKLKQQAKIAMDHNKKFMIFFAENISDELKKWLIRNNISFREEFHKKLNH